MENDNLKSIGLMIKDEITRVGIVFLCFFSIILWDEIILLFSSYKSLMDFSWIIVLFAIPESLALTIFVGVFKKEIINKIVLFIFITLVTIYYGVQLVYFRIFGSYISAAMFKMGGEAIGNFLWAAQDVIKKSVVFIVLLFIPIALIVLLILKRKCFLRYRIASHFIVLLSVICSFSVVVWGVKSIEGTERLSAIYYMYSPIVDTDSSSLKIGVLTTSLMETYKKTVASIDEKNTMIDDVKLGYSIEMVLGTAPPALENINYNELITKEAKFSNETFAEKNDGNKIEDLNFNLEGNSIELQELSDYLMNRKITSKNKYSGIFEGYNLIYICAESFWTYAVDEQVTPTLYKLSNNGFVLNNYYNSFRNTTTNGEYAYVVGLWPDISYDSTGGRDSGTFSQSSTKYMPMGMGHVFYQNGYNTYAFHNFKGSYYNRIDSYKNLGFRNIYFKDDGMSFSSDWITSDEEMAIQSVNEYINKDCFFSYYMTFSGHGPYCDDNWMSEKNIDEVKKRLGEKVGEYNEEALSYLACNLELEYAMEYLVKELDKRGILDNTVIVLAGDHYPYYLSERGRDSLAGRHLSETEIFKSKCIIYNSLLDKPIYSDAYCCNIDILPTVLNLMGIDYDSRLLMGTDVFSDGLHKAVLYDLSFENDFVKYNRKNGQVVWKIDTENYDESFLNDYLEEMNTMIESEYSASVSIIRNDYYRYLWSNSGLMQN